MNRNKIKLTNLSLLIISFALVLFFFGCQKSETISTENSNLAPLITPTPQKVEIPNFVDVPNLANKSADEFNKVFGNPVKITPIEDNPAMMPGEYREYKVTGHPKNLSVRFYKDNAKRFNLILGTPMKSAKDAVSEIFKVNVKNAASDTRDEPLSEKWKGNFDGVNFVTIYAKREKSGGDFTMVHAEIEK